MLLGILIAEALLANGHLVVGDDRSHAWSLAHRPPAARTIARFVTDSGTSVWPYAIVVAAALLTGPSPRGRAVRAVSALGILLAGQGIRLAVMQLIARPRPPRADWATHASGYSMPSGHTTTSALTAGLVCWAVAHCTSRALARCIGLFAVAWAVCVALTRVYLGVHWLSDIFAGWLLAIAYLSFVFSLAARKRSRDPSPEA